MSTNRKIFLVVTGIIAGVAIGINAMDLEDEAYNEVKVLGVTVYREWPSIYTEWHDGPQEREWRLWFGDCIRTILMVAPILYFVLVPILFIELLTLFQSRLCTEPEGKVRKIMWLSSILGFAFGLALSTYPALQTCYSSTLIRNPIKAQANRDWTPHPVHHEGEWVKHDTLSIEVFGRWN